MKTQQKCNRAILYRVRDSRGNILSDLLRDYEAAAFAECWNSRPVTTENRARVVKLNITIRESRK